MENKKFLTGSRVFFSCYPDFQSKDTDEVEFVEDEGNFFQRIITHNNVDLFQYIKTNKEEYIKFFIKRPGMEICFFLTPEVVKEIGFTIEDLKRVESMLDGLDQKHYYLRLIYEYYIENNDFVLTDEQRKSAYQNYLNARRMGSKQFNENLEYKDFLSGSCVFFSCYSDFKPHDRDVVRFSNDKNLMYKFVYDGKGIDYFYWGKHDKAKYISFYNSKPGLNACFFLTPEIAKEIGLTIEDLKQLNISTEVLGEKHEYQVIIYNAYLQNGSFTLTKEQRDEAYKSYQLSRGLET